MRAVLDSTILIDYLNGVQPAKAEIGRYERPAISVITWMEVMVGANEPSEETRQRRFLRRFETLSLSDAIAERAVDVRRRSRLKLSDAVIWATAMIHGHLLVTRNARDFPSDDPSIRIPYRL